MPKAMIHLKGGMIHVTPEKLRVHRGKGERAEWQCNDGRFEVEFKGESPFEQSTFGGMKGTSKTTGPCSPTAAKQVYPYLVRVWPEGATTPVVLDPGVEVWDDGGDDKTDAGGTGGPGGGSSKS
jgi:hypothetical protein